MEVLSVKPWIMLFIPGHISFRFFDDERSWAQKGRKKLTGIAYLRVYKIGRIIEQLKMKKGKLIVGINATNYCI